MMDKNAFNNPLRLQCMSLPELCADQIAGVRKGIEQGVPDDMLKKVRRVIITGCGDSYVAAMAAIPAFRKFAGRFGNDFSYERAIDVARYMPFDKIGGENTMVIGISCSGGPARVQEVLRRANHYGCVTLALTNNPSSPVAEEAAYRLIVNTPAFENSNPGLRNYYASLTGLYMLAAKLGEVTGCCAQGSMDAMAAAITENTAAWAGELERIDDHMYRLAETWKDFSVYDYIGDDIQFASAFFMGAKMVEVAGKMTATDDAEDWCHIGFFQKCPQNIGTVIAADKKANDRTRIGETVGQAAGIGRPVLLIANGNKDDFGISADIEICQVPDAPEGFEFLLAMMNYVPGAILAGYVSTLTSEPFFRGGGVWAQPGNGTIRSSKIEII